MNCQMLCLVIKGPGLQRLPLFNILRNFKDKNRQISFQKGTQTEIGKTMAGTIQSVTLLSLGALCYSLGSLTFAKSGALSSQINTWVGLLGIPLCIILLSLDRKFSPLNYCRDMSLYLSLLNGFVFGGAAIFLHFWVQFQNCGPSIT